MDRISQLLSNYSQNPEMIRWGLTITVAAGVFVFILLIAYGVFVAFNPARARVRQLAGHPGTGASTAERIGDRLEPLSGYILPKKGWERTRIESQLVHAGYRSPQALLIFYAIKLCLGVAMPLIVLAAAPYVSQMLEKPLSLLHIAAAALFFSFTGMVMTNFFLNRMVERRQRAIQKGFPDALDMLVVCVEAGIGLTDGISRVSKELEFSHPQLADEFGLVNAEIRMGVERGDALRNMAHRTGVEDVQVFAGLISQTLRFGTSIADTLRTYAEDFRDKRMQKAEEQAAKIGTKMIFPLILCLFPSFFVVAVGPAIIKVVAAFG